MVKLMAEVYYHDSYKIAVSFGSSMLHATELRQLMQKILKKLHIVHSLCSLQSECVNKQGPMCLSTLILSFKAYLSQVYTSCIQNRANTFGAHSWRMIHN
jgi:hypothetical protein